jgi:hypothetical protein
MVYTYNSVGSKANTTNSSDAKYLPRIISVSLNGFVCNHSIVPPLNSSANERIVTAGIKSIKNQGANSKNLSSVA